MVNAKFFRIPLILIACFALLNSLFAQKTGNLSSKNRIWDSSNFADTTLIFSTLHPVVTKQSLYLKSDKSRSWFLRKALHENFIIVDTSDFQLCIDPLFNFSYTNETDYDQSIYNNSRGVIVKGMLGEKIYFESSFTENQSFFASYITDFTKSNKIVPGLGFVKPFKDGGYDYAYATGIVSYSPSTHFNFQFGHGKNFIGDGYRSLLLSDAAFFYPHLKITTQFWKFQYTNMYATFLDLNQAHTYEGGFQRKYGTFHFLDFAVTDWFSMGLFEAIMWQAADSSGKRGYDINYLNPIIFYRPVEFSLGSPDNAIMGATFKIQPLKNYTLYGQFVLDDLDIEESRKATGFILNKYGYQLGMKTRDFLNIKNLNWLCEYNLVRPYVFAHKTPLQNYSHYRQSLAHPYGANFYELVGMISYTYKRFSIDVKLNMANYGKDTTGSHWGKDIFISDFEAQRGYPSYGNEVGQGVNTDFLFFETTLHFIINPESNIVAFISYAKRKEENNLNSTDHSFVTIGVKTNVFNFYNDF